MRGYDLLTKKLKQNPQTSSDWLQLASYKLQD